MSKERHPHSTKADIAVGLGALITAGMIVAPFWNPDYSSGNFEPSTPAVPTIPNGENQYYTVMAERRSWSWREYESDGVSFRRTIKLLQEKDPEKALRLQEFYTALKIWNGVEYLTNGEVFSPQEGDIFEISDPSIKNPGIFLRHKPQIETDPYTDNSFLYDGVEVKLWKKVETGEGEEKKTLWEIEVMGRYPLIYNEELMAKPGEKGFVSQEWLGYRVKP